MNTDFTSRAGGRRNMLIAAACVAVALTGCTQARVSHSEVTGEVPQDYRRTHPIAIEESLAIMDIPVGMSSAVLTDPVKANINGFARGFVSSGSAVIAVVAPSGSQNELAASALAVQVEDVIRRSGVEARAIEYRVYRAGAHETNAPIRIAYNRITAHTAPCGPWRDQVAENEANRSYGNFGCATQQNLAAMVASPLDLLYPRGMTPADASRRASVLEKYRKGEAFTSDLTAEQGGQVAQGVGQ